MSKWTGSTSLAGALALGTLLGVGSAHAADEQLDTGFVFDMVGLENCEAIPLDMPPDQVRAGLAQAEASGQMILGAEMTGFMAGRHNGWTFYGTGAGDAGYGSVSYFMAPLPTGNYAAFCIAIIQVGEVPVATGKFPVIGVGGMDGAKAGDMLAAAAVVALFPMEAASSDGRPVYRKAIIGEGLVSAGEFELVAFGTDDMEAEIRLEGVVRMREGGEEMPFALDVKTRGEYDLPNVPTIRASE